jgi:uncharacterized protein YajQ (UPF0234 family)
MPSFDIVSKIDYAELDNTLNNTRKEILTRYDFQNLKTELTLDKKEKKLHIHAPDSMKMEAIKEMLMRNAAKRKLDLRIFDFQESEQTTGMALKREVKLKEGIEKDVAKKIVAAIKEAKLKVQPSIQGDEVRVSGKQRDDLQQAMALVKAGDFGVACQFVNFKD